jgi:hypothetical protein
MPKLQRLLRSICLQQWPVRQQFVEDCMVPGPAGVYAKLRRTLSLSTGNIN